MSVVFIRVGTFDLRHYLTKIEISVSQGIERKKKEANGIENTTRICDPGFLVKKFRFCSSSSAKPRTWSTARTLGLVSLFNRGKNNYPK